VFCPGDWLSKNIRVGVGRMLHSLPDAIKAEMTAANSCLILDLDLRPIHTLAVVEFKNHRSRCSISLEEDEEEYLALKPRIQDCSNSAIPQVIESVRRNVVPGLGYMEIKPSAIPFH
jgi:hypothetical protein